VDPRDPLARSKILCPEALRGCGALLLDAKGRRFCNELGTRDYVSQRILEHEYGHEQKEATLFFNEVCVLAFIVM
jgi:aspartate oxidase